MTLKFCANLSFMFQEEASILKRYTLASSCGFKAVECAWPYDYSAEDVVRFKNEAKVKQVLINTPVDKDGPGKLGFAALPGMESRFMEGFKTAVKYAKELDSSFIHIMSGTVCNPNDDNYSTYVSNIKSALKMLENENITALIEPINKHSVPDYYMNCYDKAVKVIQDINSDKLKLMLDLFHLQQIRGNLSRNIKELMPLVGHVQVAQVPDRHEPHTPGEVDYRYIFKQLESHGYNGWIGLEYKPLESSSNGLDWIQIYGYSL